MIDTDKYEGHTKGKWNVYGPYPLQRHGDYDDEGIAQALPFTQADVKLIADAPKLLAEVMRLRIIVIDMFYTADELEAEQLLFNAVGDKYNYKQMIADFKRMIE